LGDICDATVFTVVILTHLYHLAFIPLIGAEVNW
jgi:hypothetical protein